MHNIEEKKAQSSAALPHRGVDEPNNRLKEIRELSGITQVELADAAGIAQSRLSEFENGSRRLISASAGTVLKLARALNVTVEELIS